MAFWLPIFHWIHFSWGFSEQLDQLRYRCIFSPMSLAGLSTNSSKTNKQKKHVVEMSIGSKPTQKWCNWLCRCQAQTSNMTITGSKWTWRLKKAYQTLFHLQTVNTHWLKLDQTQSISMRWVTTIGLTVRVCVSSLRQQKHWCDDLVRSCCCFRGHLTVLWKLRLFQSQHHDSAVVDGRSEIDLGLTDWGEYMTNDK